MKPSELPRAASPPTLIAQRYEVLRQLGHGGVAEAFEVFDTAERRHVALKRMLQRSSAHNEQMHASFRREYSLLSQFTHPNIVRVYDFGLENGTPYYTMELVQGEHPGAAGPMRWPEVCRLLLALCEPLSELHGRGWVHRDLSPRNVYLGDDGTPKLLDFGAIAAMDAHERPLGTPPCMAPETQRRQRIDARTDIYGLGALAYYALTGRHAYPARLLGQLPLLWQTPPPKPSALEAGIPEALDQLVLSMLSLDMDGRPRQLSQVMQRLAAIAQIPFDRHSQATLTTARLIGRDTELEQLRDLLRWCEEGRGGTCVVRGARGAGCTRLLDAMCQEAKLLGHAVLTANVTRCGTGNFAAILELYQAAASLEPERASACAQGLEQDLAAFEMGVNESVEAVAAQRAFVAFCERWVREQPLLLVVHEADDIDPHSAKLLLQLQRRAANLRLTIALSQRSKRSQQGSALAALTRDASLITLAAFDGEGVERLLRALFGDIPHVAQLAHWMLRTTQGEPAVCMATARMLVASGRIQFLGGQWQLPEHLDELGSAEVGDDLDARFERLSPTAKDLLCLLALVTQPFPLKTSLYRRALRKPEAAAISAEGELLAAHVLVASTDGYALNDISLLARVRAHLTELEINDGHARLSYFYAVEGQLIAATYHLWKAYGIAEADGALGNAISLLGIVHASESRRFPHSPEAVSLYEALLAYRKQREAPAIELYPLRMALLSATTSNPALCKYAPETLAQLRVDAGIDLWDESGSEQADQGARIQRCLEQAKLRHEQSPAQARGLSPEHAVQAIARCTTLLTGAYAMQYDVEQLLQLRRLVAPLRSLSPLLELTTQLAEIAEASTMLGDESQSLRARVLEVTSHPVAGLDTSLRERLHHVSSFYLALDYAAQGHEAARALANKLSEISEFEALGLQILRLHALGQGRFEEAQWFRRERELLSFQSERSEQHLSMSQLRELGLAYECRDLLELTRCTTTVAERAARYPGWKPWAALGKAFCHLLGDDPHAALSVADSAIAQLRPFAHGAWQHLMWAKAEAQNDLRQHAAAKDTMLEVLQTAEQRGLKLYRGAYYEAVFWVAEAGLGNRETALKQLDELVAAQAAAGAGNTVAFGRLCESRCQAACIVKDYTGFAKHLELMEPVYANHPSLRVRHARWVQAGKDRFRKLLDLLNQADAGAAWALRPSNDVQPVALQNQATYLLSMILDEIAVDAGQLYRVDADGELQLMAARPTRPDRTLQLAAQRCLSAWTGSDESLTADGDEEPGAAGDLHDGQGRSYVPLWLTRPTHPDQLAGFVLVACSTERLAELPPAFIRAISQHLDVLES